ncbi:MAG TPA: hypothetical protein VFF73_36890 [Planctomycetota bacterium]|nr:hypothetical protein [Planctomycetota bacterium]
MTDRTCGACAACCYIPAVPSLGKGEYELCRHSSASGCGVYASRPRECRDYSCLWLSSELGELTDRPDRVGLVFDRPSLIEEHADYAGVPFVCAREIHADAREGERAAELLRRLARAWVVRLTSPDGRTRLTGPAPLIELLMERARARAAAEAPRSGS